MTMRRTSAASWSILVQVVLSLVVVKVISVTQAAEASASHGGFEIPRGKRILPYSLYLQKIEERRQSQQTGISSPDGNRPPLDQFLPSAVVNQQPVSIYLPAFANATSEHIASRHGGERQKDELGATNDDSPGEKLFSTKGASSPSSPYINAFSVRPRASSSISAGRASSSPIRPQLNRNYVVTTTPLSSSQGQPPQPSDGAGSSSQTPGNPFAAPIPPSYGKGQTSLNSVDNELVKSFGEIGDGRKKQPLGGQPWESAEGGKAHSGPTNPYYSTSANREPLQFERTSMFRPSKGTKSGGGGDHSKQYPWTHSASSAENSLITRPTSMFQSMRSTNTAKSIPSTMQYSKLSPAPGHTLSMSASDRNIVDSIFSQSQSKRYPNPPNSEMRSQVRYAPLPNPIHPVNGPPLSGSPFDFFGGAAHPFGGAAQNGIGGAQGGAGGVPLFNPLELLGQGSTIEQISKIAKNLLSMGSGNPELFSAVSKAIGGGAGAADPSSKLTSTATNSVIQPESAAASLIKAATSLASGKNPLLLPKIDSAGDVAAVNETTAALNGTTVDVQALLALAGNSTLVADPKKLLAVLPQEQRSLLEAAIRNGELDGGKLDPTLLGTTSSPVSAGPTPTTETSTLPTPTTRNGGVIKSENRLMEWIQQNRPRPSEKSDAPTMLLAADKLPYYGRYCGSFVEKLDAQNRRRFNIAGALWAVDDRRLIVSNFHFQPGSRYENITFLGGPANFTRTVTDFFPSANGFYLRPEPIAMQAFLLQQKSERVASRLRSPTAADREKKTAEEEELEGENSTLASPLSRNELGSKRMKRNLYDELYENSKRGVTPIMMPGHFTTTSLRAGPVSALEPNRFPQFTGAPMDIGSTTMHTPSPTLLDNLGTVGAAPTPASLTPTPTPTSLRIITGGTITSASLFPVVSTAAAALPPSTPPPNAVLDGGPTQRATPNNESGIVPLEWSAGFQPLLLTLPEGRLVRNLRWVALWDHNRHESVAFVLIPNGAAFQIPSMVQLRAVTANGAHQVSSGPIRVLDTKTIEINEFSLTTNGLPTWFMAGKEIMPNANGHIVPVFNRANSSFDCDALRDYKNETVTLRLPGTMDIKDVFWFSVYSIPTGVSLAHMYLPYNDMHLPPDLLPLPAPQCYWRPK